MRTLPLLLVALLVNDALLLVLLDASVPAWGFVVGGALALTALILAVVAVAVDKPDRRTVADLQADVEALRERVETLEADR